MGLVVGALERGQGVGDGGGGGERPQRRLPKAEVRYIARQKAHCHAKGGSPGKLEAAARGVNVAAVGGGWWFVVGK